jgi:beta-1,2-mannobiose phosphorylase / 1,2-beta-oligomannan phosphorylase
LGSSSKIEIKLFHIICYFIDFFFLKYNVGYCILDGHNPTMILERSDQPIFSPELDWEKGNNPGAHELGLTPNVVFIEGWAALEGKKDAFIFFYGAADSVVGAALLEVFID